ncbi:TauD/TfdA dioxygenase family protein [Sphingomonas bacterium]|uniref:TauD/TfdA dioxygenase family protein n=1 Tax=Sphingomonas bacterium TaxID=1895847 RepID=UPI001576049C|nr:TauD/TfdA family dioxygenase [Sphingomonas bacterium]
MVVRGQTLAPEDLVDFAGRFGPVEYGVREDYQLPENPDVYVISNIVENGKPIGNPSDGFAWHTDLSFLEHPTAYTFLYALEVPEEGGDTEFANVAVSYDKLPAEQKARLDRMSVRHSYTMLHATRKNARALTEEEERRMPDVIHPMVRTHPATARKALYLGPDTSLPVGLDPDEGSALILSLMKKATEAQEVYAHHWRAGDLVVWDNRTMVHRATEYDRARYRRHLHRVTVRGERPF